MSVTKLMNLLGALAAGVLALSIPLVYVVFSLYSLQKSHVTEAAYLAKSVEKIVQDRPDMWEFESIRLIEFISQPSIDGQPAEREILTAAGKLVAKTVFTEPRPAISVSASFFDSGRLAGSVIVRYSLRTQMIVTALLGILSSFLGCLIYFLFRIHPLRKLESTLKALRESEEKYRSLSSTVDRVYLVDRNCRFLFANEKYLDTHGPTRDSVLGSTYDESHDQEPSNIFANAINHVFETGNDYQDEYCSNRHGVTRQFIRTFSPVRDNDNHITAVTVVSKDITERKRLEAERLGIEERLHRAEKMEALGTLAGGVAHDLNNVLGVLMGYSDMLMEKISEGNPLRIYADNILKSAEKGASIIQDLLTLARRGVSVSKVMNLNDIISGFLRSPVFEKLQSYHPRVTFRTELDKSLFNIKGSPVHLEKAVMNLISNAAEAIVDSGTVTIRTENRYLDRAVRGYDQVQEGEYVVLTVSDNGSGIQADDLGKIFEPFYTKKVMGRSGTGLGLAVIWGTVKDHNGYIDVQSEYGNGSTFALYFPVTREEVGADLRKIPVAQYRGRGESILVVDDVKEQREMAAMMLKRLGYDVQTVSGGQEAVEYLKTGKADLLVLDMIMDPGIDGLETYRRVREINPDQKAVLVSGFSETNQVKTAQGLGAGAYVRKPYVIEKLGLAVRTELDRPAGTREP